MSLRIISYDRWDLSENWELIQGLFKNCCLMNSQPTFLFLTQWIMATLSKGCRPRNFKPYNSLKLSFTNIWILRSNFAESESFFESNSPDILALCDDKLGRLNWFWQFLCDGLPSFNPKRFYYSYYSYLARDLFLENSTDSYSCFRLASLHSVSYFFFLYQSPSLSLCTVFNSISSNIDEVLSMNPSANVFVFEDYNVHHKDWLNYSGGTDRAGKLCNYLKQLYSDSYVSYSDPWLRFLQSSLLDLLFSSDSSNSSPMAFPPLGILIILLSQFPLTFQ